MCVLYDLVVGKLNNVVVGWLVAYYINLSLVNLSIVICAEWINNWIKVVGISTFPYFSR